SGRTRRTHRRNADAFSERGRHSSNFCSSRTGLKKENSMIKIKICGVTNLQDALWAVNLGTDYIGLNFYPESPRKVSPKNAKDIVAKLPPFVVPVGIFVNEDVAAILKLIKLVPLKAVQLHGQETPEMCRELKATGVQVIKVISLAGPLNPTEWTAY